MKNILMLAGAAGLASTRRALAKPGNGPGHGQGNVHAHGTNGLVGYGAGGCPPGLAKKNPPCVPPGQAKKLFGVGQRFVPGLANPYAYNRIPYDLRSEYGLNPYNNYYYGN